MLYPMMKGNRKKTNKSNTRDNKQKEEFQYCKKSNHLKEKSFWSPINPNNKLKGKPKVVVNEVST